MIKYPWDQSRFMLDIDECSRSRWLDINHIIYKYLQTHPVNSELFIFYFQTSFVYFDWEFDTRFPWGTSRLSCWCIHWIHVMSPSWNQSASKRCNPQVAETALINWFHHPQKNVQKTWISMNSWLVKNELLLLKPVQGDFIFFACPLKKFGRV